MERIGPAGDAHVRRVAELPEGDGVVPGGALLTFEANFFAGDVNQRQGVPVAALELDGDGRADIVAGRPPVFRSFDANFNPLGGVFVG